MSFVCFICLSFCLSFRKAAILIVKSSIAAVIDIQEPVVAASAPTRKLPIV
jgi:hypothetical protein